jgi:hypothetical protein
MRLIFSDLTYPKLGGAENLIYRIVKTAFAEHGVRSVLIGSPDSFILKRLDEDAIPYTFYPTHSFAALRTTPSDRFVHFHYYDGLDKLKNLSGKCVVWGILAGQITGWNRFGFELIRTLSFRNSC